MKQPKTEVVIRSFDQFKRFVEKWAKHDFEADPRTITNKRYVRKRTISQNSTIHMLIRRLSEHTGDDFLDLKTQIKEAFGPHVEKTVTFDDEITYMEPKSIEDYDIEESSMMIEKILYLASNHFGIILEIEDK